MWKGEFASNRRTPETLRVVDWNIDRGERLEQIGSALERLAPDLCLIQEADLAARRSGNRNVAEELARRLRLNYVFAPEFQELGQSTGGEPSFQGQAVLTGLPVLATHVIRFQEQSGFWRPRAYLPDLPLLQRRLGGRIALVEELQWAGRKLVVYNAHLESRSLGRIQTLQLDEILADTRRYPPDTPMILAGDLNTKYNASAFTRKLSEAGWRSAFGEHEPRTHVLIGRLDWVLVRGPLKIEYGRVLKSVGGSDHFPLSAAVAAE
jgi:endonuclease/exonuclease/phosphatase family metal-dependent hydrolase